MKTPITLALPDGTQFTVVAVVKDGLAIHRIH